MPDPGPRPSAVRTVAAVVAGPSAAPLLAPLAGRPVIEHAVAAFEAAPLVGEILVVTPPALAARAARLLAAGGYRKLSRVIGGSATRAESVRRAIGALGGAGGNLLIHDATRPLVSPRVIADCAAALRDCRAVCAAVPAADTMVRAEGGLITERPPRDRLRRRQTPQGFRLDVICRGHELALAGQGPEPADDCAIVLRYLPEVAVRLVPGSEPDVTVTGPAGLAIAEALLAAGLP